MAFVMKPKASLKTKVVVTERGDFGKEEKSDFVIDFRKLSVADLLEIRTLGKGEDAFSDEVFEKISETIKGWEGVLTSEKEEMPFSNTNLWMLLDWTEARRAIFFAFWEVQNGHISKN